MPFKPGHKKTGGIKKGASTKRMTYSAKTVEEIKEDVKPLEILAGWAKDPDPATSIPACRELCKYIYPTLRSVEVKAEVNAKIESSQCDKVIDELFEIIKHMSNGTKK